MIHGIGTDILQISRIDKLYQHYSDALSKRVLSVIEREQISNSKDKVRFISKRFAAKEAFAKAIGTGIRYPVSLHQITIKHDELGKPEFDYSQDLQAFLRAKNIQYVHLSLSDEKDYIVAFAIAEKS